MIDVSSQNQLLNLYPVLKKIRTDQWEKALKNSIMVRHKAGVLMWEETQKIEYFPFVLKGRGRVYKLAPNGRELHLYSVGPGDGCVLATGSLINNSMSNARAVCEVDYEMIGLPLLHFKTLMNESDVFRDYILTGLSDSLS